MPFTPVDVFDSKDMSLIVLPRLRKLFDTGSTDRLFIAFVILVVSLLDICLYKELINCVNYKRSDARKLSVRSTDPLGLTLSG